MAIDLVRKNSRIQEIPIDRPNDEVAQYAEPVSSEDLEGTVIGDITVSEALNSLEEREREIVNLKLFADFTFSEIAHALNMPLGTVSWKYRSAIKKMSDRIKEVQKID